MQKLASLIFLFSSALLANISVATAYNPGSFEFSRSFDKGIWEYAVGVDHFASTANFKEADSFEKLVSGDELKLTQIPISARWVPKTKYGLFLGTAINNVETHTLGIVRTNSTIAETQLGADYLFYWGQIDMIPVLSASIPTQRIDVKTDEAINTDGAMKIAGTLLMRKAIDKFYANWRVGFLYQDDGRASYVPWGLGASWNTESFEFGADLSGQQVVAYDVDTDNKQTRLALLNRVNGGSYKFYSINPYTIDLQGWLKYNLDESVGLVAGAGTTMTGANAAAGYNLFAKITYTFQSAATSRKIKGIEPEKALEHFQPDLKDGVDQNVFKPAPPPPAEKPLPPEMKVIIKPQKPKRK
jgi:hypothetical protein